MDTNQIVLLVMIAVGILFLVISLVLSAREKTTKTGEAEKELDIEAYKAELREEMNRLFDSCMQTAQEKLEASAKEALDGRVQEAGREIEVAANEAKEYMEKLLETSQTKMEECVKQTQENTTGIAGEVKRRIEEIDKNDVAQLKQDVENVRKEIVERQKETEMLYALLNDKQNQLIESIEQEQQRARTLSDTVEAAQTRAQSFAERSFSQEKSQMAGVVSENAGKQSETQKDAAKGEAAGAQKAAQAVEAAEELPQKAEAEEALPKSDGVLQQIEYALRQIEEAQPRAKKARQAKEAQQAEETQQAGEAQQAEETQQVEEAQQAEETQQVEEAQQAGEAQQADEARQAKETQQLSTEQAYAESTAFDEVRPRRRRRKKHFLQKAARVTEGSDSGESDLTKPIDRGEIRDALHAQPRKAAETLAAKTGGKKETSAPETEETQSEAEGEIDIDEVVVADVEDLESIATETVKEAMQEVLDEDEGLLGYAETTWEQDAEDSAGGARQVQEEEKQEEEAAQEAEEPKREEKKRGARRKKKSVVWELSKKEPKDETPAPVEEEEKPQEESLPADMIIEDEPNKLLHAVRSSGTVSTEADLNMRANVLRMYDGGHSSMEIAEALGLGIGEVRMIVDLYSRRER